MIVRSFTFVSIKSSTIASTETVFVYNKDGLFRGIMNTTQSNTAAGAVVSVRKPPMVPPTLLPARPGSVESIETKFVWEIKDFPDSPGALDFAIESPRFNAFDFNFGLVLYTNAVHKDERYVRINIRGPYYENQHFIFGPLRPSVRISLLNKENSEEDFEHRLNKVVYLQDKISKMYNRQAVLSECVKYKTLRVVCTVTSGKIVPVDASQYVPRKRLKSCLEAMDSFKKLFNKEELSDVVFCVEGRNIYAQKSILICKSPVFAAMFSGDNLENKTNKVDIIDNTYDAMYAMLEYIYTGITDEHVNLDCVTCLGVLVAAEKYDLAFLKEKFQEIICDKLANDNVLECLVTADSNNAVQLKQKCINYIVFKRRDIVKMDSFKKFLSAHVDLTHEIFSAMST